MRNDSLLLLTEIKFHNANSMAKVEKYSNEGEKQEEEIGLLMKTKRLLFIYINRMILRFDSDHA